MFLLHLKPPNVLTIMVYETHNHTAQDPNAIHSAFPYTKAGFRHTSGLGGSLRVTWENQSVF